MTSTQEWSGHPAPDDPDNVWIDDVTGERVDARTGERTPVRPQITFPYRGVEYTRDQLQAVFNLVANAENWKLPIDTVLVPGAATKASIEAAVIFLTGSIPTIREVTGYVTHRDGLVAMPMQLWQVTADGYYKAIGP